MTPSGVRGQRLFGTWFHAPTAGRVEVLTDTVVAVASEGTIEAFCRRHGFRAMHGRHETVDGVTLALLGYSNITPFDTPGEYSETEFEQRLAPFAGLKPMVLICHSPPKDSRLDRAGERLHFGSTAIRRFLEREQPALLIPGMHVQFRAIG